MLFTQSGKFPHLMASVPGSKETSKLTIDGEVELNFGEVPVQTSANKWIELHNVSPVSTLLNSVICCHHFPCAMHVFSYGDALLTDVLVSRQLSTNDPLHKTLFFSTSIQALYFYISASAGQLQILGFSRPEDVGSQELHCIFRNVHDIIYCTLLYSVLRCRMALIVFFSHFTSHSKVYWSWFKLPHRNHLI